MNGYFTLASYIILKEYILIINNIHIDTPSVTLALEAPVPRMCSPKQNEFLLASVCMSTSGPHSMELELWSEKLSGEPHRDEFVGVMPEGGLPELYCCLQSRLCS